MLLLLTPLVLPARLIGRDKYIEMFQQAIAFWCPAKKRRIMGIMFGSRNARRRRIRAVMFAWPDRHVGRTWQNPPAMVI